MDVNLREFKRGPEGSVRVSRQAEPQEELIPQERPDMTEGGASQPRKSSKGPWIVAITVIVVLAALGYVFRGQLFARPGGFVSSANFQAVFLTNGQVYFGKLADTGGRYVTMENIYYLQITPILQTKTEDQPGTQATQQQQLSLVKLGNELHGPVDKMSVNRDQILFIEDLKEDGRVVQAIKDFESGQKK